MKKTWTIKGRIRVADHIIPNIEDVETGWVQEENRTIKQLLPVAEVPVKISATKKDAYSNYKKWGTTITDGHGYFELQVEKKDVPHIFAVSVNFDDHTLKVRSSTHNNGWKTIASTFEHVDDDVVYMNTILSSFAVEEHTDLPNFENAARDFLMQDIYSADLTAYRDTRLAMMDGVYYDRQQTLNTEIHQKAWNWVMVKLAMNYLEGIGVPFRKKFKLDLNNVMLVGGDSFAGIAAHLGVYETENYVLTTLYHEIMHMWDAQNSRGIRIAMAIGIHGGSHELQESPMVAFTEGFAEFAAEQLMSAIFNLDKPKILTKQYLNQPNFELNSLSRVQRNDTAVKNCLHLLCAPNPSGIRINGDPDITDPAEFASAPPYAEEDINLRRGCRVAPILSFADILSIFQEHPEMGENKRWGVGRASNGLYAFLVRGFKVLPHFSEQDYEQFIDVIDPRLDVDYSDYCELPIIDFRRIA